MTCKTASPASALKSCKASVLSVWGCTSGRSVRQDQPAIGTGCGFDGSGNAVAHAGVGRIPHARAGLRPEQRPELSAKFTDPAWPAVCAWCRPRRESALPACGENQHTGLLRLMGGLTKTSCCILRLSITLALAARQNMGHEPTIFFHCRSAQKLRARRVERIRLQRQSTEAVDQWLQEAVSAGVLNPMP